METLNIFNRPHIMVDLETLSTHNNAVIVSIGAVCFTFEDGIGEEFLVNVDPISCTNKGLHVEKSTVEWWAKQPKEVRDMWKVSPKPIEVALNHFNNFVGSNKNQFLWSQGSFDTVILRSASKACSVLQPWKYWQEMDLRTTFNLLGIRNDKIRAKESGHHSALDDARSQAQTLIGLFT